MLDLVIVGAGGFGRELYEMLWDAFSPEQYRLKGFLAQDDGRLAQHGIEARVLADPEEYTPAATDRFLLAIGQMEARRRAVEALTGRGGQFVSLIHPLARVARTARVAAGAVIYPFAVVSNNASLATCVHLNYYASVGHDCCLGRYCLLAPYATLNGFVQLADEVYVSTHATVAPGRRLGYRCKLSANSACMQDAAENSLIFGVPGRQVRRLD
jgi:sugar O-acyltransferase (sialic acid O-acetyltransferase NeuD family)